MNAQQIEKYVSEYFNGATGGFLQEIVDHGIYNTGADVIQGDDDEYTELHDEFERQAKSLLRKKKEENETIYS